MHTCPECSNTIDDNAIFCDNCGLPLANSGDQGLFVTGALIPGRVTDLAEDDALPASSREPQAGTCSACGYVNVLGEMFCQNCGVQLSPITSTPPPPPTPAASFPKEIAVNNEKSFAICRTCGFANLSAERYCSKCGAQLSLPDSRVASDVERSDVCPGCGSKNPPSVDYCINCGYQLFDRVVSAEGDKPKGSTDNGTCSFCGYPRTSDEAFCDNCGMQHGSDASGATSEKPTSSESRSASASTQVPSTLVCPGCGHPHTAKEQYCDNCGLQFPSDQAGASQPDTNTEESGKFAELARISGRLIVQTTRAEIKLPDGKEELYIGRSDPVREIFPDVDLSSYGAASAGVSRRHIRLSRSEAHLFIEDLNSTNFSYLNKRRLDPNQRYPLNDGDEIRLGLFVLEFRSA